MVLAHVASLLFHDPQCAALISMWIGPASSWEGLFFFFKAEVGIRVYKVTGVQTCALPICKRVVRSSPPLPASSPQARSSFQQAKLFPLPPPYPRSSPPPVSEASDHPARKECPSPPHQIGRASCRERV